MGIVHRTTASLRDYQIIWDYVARDNVTAADELLRTFDAKIELLSDYPKAGPARPELRARVRSFPVGDYLLFYRPIRGGIELLRVLHGARNLRKSLREG
jgi:toxin ParE1/3/4